MLRVVIVYNHSLLFLYEGGERMDSVKRIEILRKRNEVLEGELNTLKEILNDNEESYKEDNVRVVELIQELEDIKAQWLILVDELKKYRDEYSVLISDLRKMKSILLSGNKLNTPWYKKLFHRKE